MQEKMLMGKFKGNVFIKSIFIRRQFKNFIPFCNVWGLAGPDTTLENMPQTQTNNSLDEERGSPVALIMAIWNVCIKHTVDS